MNYLDLEMSCARVMARQEASGFQLDLGKAEDVQEHLGSPL